MIGERSESSLRSLGSDEEEETLCLKKMASTVLSEDTEAGLTDEQARDSFREHGPNMIDPSEGWLEDLRQGFCRLVCNPLIGLLAALGCLSFLTGDYSTGTVITVMALISIILSAYHQFSAEKAARALSAGFDTTVRVARGPRGRTVMQASSKSLVPGDVVLVSAGDLIPADLMMMTSSRLIVNQSILTGESMPVEKKANPRAYAAADAHAATGLKKGCCGSSNRCSTRFRTGVLEGVSEYLTDDEICFMGTHVESGSAVGRVIATGDETRVGQMAESLKGLRPKSAFDKGIEKFGALMLQFTLIMCPLVLIIQTCKSGWSTEAFLYAVSVGVGLTPEMLPVVVTVCLALGARTLSSNENVIVKHLDCLPTLGQLDVLCVDKTGTLTRDAARVELSVTAAGTPHPAAIKMAKLHSRHQTGIQNAVEKAIHEADEGLPVEVRIDATDNDDDISVFPIFDKNSSLTIAEEWPFDFERRRSSVLLAVEEEGGDHDDQNHDRGAAEASAGAQALLVMKGAPSEVIERCTHYFETGKKKRESKESNAPSSHDALSRSLGGHTLPLNHEGKTRALSTLKEWENQGLRAIAVACVSGSRKELAASGELSEFCLLGYLFLADPPKPSAAAAVSSLKGLGVKIIVLTGDSAEVTRHVCAQVGLTTRDRSAMIDIKSSPPTPLRKPKAQALVYTGSEVQMMSDAKLQQAVKRTTIFAKLQPMDKERIVKCLQDCGYAVGFLGDGVNDCAALRAADVGVSVDTGLDVAKAAADVVLADKSLMALDSCVRSGRHVFANIIKYIKMAASSNWGNMFSVVAASMFIPFVPMLPLQVVAGNLLYDFSQLSIPTDNVPAWHLTRPLCWDIGAIARFVVLLGPVSSIFDFLTFYAAYWYFGGREDPATFRTAWFVEGILSQLMIVFILRTAVPETSKGHPIPTPELSAVDARKYRCWPMGCGGWEGGPSITLVVVTILMGAIAVTISQVPQIGEYFEFVPLPPHYWPWLALILTGYASLTLLLMSTVLPRLLHWRSDSSSADNELLRRVDSSSSFGGSRISSRIQVVVDKES